jgi:hypothetical protein
MLIMRTNLYAPLTPDEFASLKALDRGSMTRVIPEPHERRLLELGFAKQTIIRLMLTHAGRMRIAVGE